MPLQYLAYIILLLRICSSVAQQANNNSAEDHTDVLPKVPLEKTTFGSNPIQFTPEYTEEFLLESPAGRNSLRDVWIGKIFADSMWQFVPSGANQTCSQHGQDYGEQLRNNTLWAVRMYDASAVSISGLLDGDHFQYGHTDQCLYTRAPHFTTQYCLPSAEFAPIRSDATRDFFANRSSDWPPYDARKPVWDFLRPRPPRIRDTRTRFHWGVCVPSSCSPEDIRSSLQATLGEAFQQHGINLKVDLNGLMCYSAQEVESRKLPKEGNCFLCFILLLLLLVIIGTAADCFRKTLNPPDTLKTSDTLNPPIILNPPGTLNLPDTLNPPGILNPPDKGTRLESFLSSFSLPRNVNRLCTADPKEDLIIVHGIKFFTMCFVILYHRGILGMSTAQNLTLLEEILHDPSYFLFNASTQMLDIFFYLAGFLLAWSLIQRRNEGKTRSPPLIIVYRAVRIYPILLTFMAFVTWVQPYIGEGPRWKAFSLHEQDLCKKYWWQNVLFLSSLPWDSGNICVPISWFLSTDFQLFLVSLGIICLAETFPKRRITILISSFVIAHVIPSVVIYYTKETSFWIITVQDLENAPQAHYIRTLYVKFYVRSPPYIFGVCAAYVLHTARKSKFKFTRIQKLILFILLLSVNLATFYIGALFLLPGVEYNVWQHVLFAPIMRIILPACLCVIMWVHMSDGFGVISDILSHPVFIPLGRITFHMYLIHFYVQAWDVFTLYSSPHYNLYTMILRTCGDIFLTVLISFGTTLLIESPMGILRKKLIKI